MHMPSLPVVIPLMVAAILAALSGHLHRRALDTISLGTSAVVLAACISLMRTSAKGVIIYWFGGWQPAPHSHFPVGICFMIDPIGAGLAALIALLVLAAFTFSWSYFESVKSLYHTLMLVFLAAMCGLSLSGDLFNLFVWFELMTATAVALCGYKSEESQPLQGALNFAVANTIGAFLSLTGVALLYAATGSLNMMEVGATLASNPPGRHFLAVAFLFVIAGFLVKSAAFPFHFWLADAHAVAPTPVCILFSGVMVEVGLYAIARIYWTVFASSSQEAIGGVRAVFLAMGAATAVIGAMFCYGQRHLKRLLAFSTISHVGMMVLGFALLDPTALSGTALYVLGHGMIKGSLFIGAGILLHRFRSVDEYDIRKMARQIAPIGVMMVVGAWGLAGLPPFATFSGGDEIERIAGKQHLIWFPVVVIFAEVLTAAAVLRFSGRVFFGLGRRRSMASRGAPHIHMEPETKGTRSHVPAFMWAPMAGLLILAMFVGRPLHHGADYFAAQFQNPQVYAKAVLQDSTIQIPAPAAPANLHHATVWWERIVVALGTIGLAALGLFPLPRKARLSRWMEFIFTKPLEEIRPLQSGRVGDYVAWLAFGIAVYGALLLLIH